MTPAEWNRKFAEASGGFAWLAAEGMRLAEDVTERDGEFDELEYVVAVKSKRGDRHAG